MSNSKYLNKVFTTNEGYNIKIIDINTLKNVTVVFEDGMTRSNISLSAILRGNVRNFNHRSNAGIGYIGYGKYKTSDYSVFHKIWDKIIRRVYDTKTINRRISYTKAKMCKEWENFQNFAKWCEENYIEGWTIDKDLLSNPNNKIYSPSTCCFLPNDLNNILSIRTAINKKLPVGVINYKNKYRVQFSKYSYPAYYGDYNTVEEAVKIYIKYKKEYIIEVANKYKTQLKPHVYEKLINYDIKEIYHSELYDKK